MPARDSTPVWGTRGGREKGLLTSRDAERASRSPDLRRLDRGVRFGRGRRDPGGPADLRGARRVRRDGGGRGDGAEHPERRRDRAVLSPICLPTDRRGLLRPRSRRRENRNVVGCPDRPRGRGRPAPPPSEERRPRPGARLDERRSSPFRRRDSRSSPESPSRERPRDPEPGRGGGDLGHGDPNGARRPPGGAEDRGPGRPRRPGHGRGRAGRPDPRRPLERKHVPDVRAPSHRYGRDARIGLHSVFRDRGEPLARRSARGRRFPGDPLRGANDRPRRLSGNWSGGSGPSPRRPHSQKSNR
jgi:hypothetical protein